MFKTPASWCFSGIFQDELYRGKKIVRSFLFTAKFITKHSSERFLSIFGQKMSKGF